MNGFHEWDDFPEQQQVTEEQKIKDLIGYSESKIRWGVLAAIVVVTSTCVLLLAYC